MMEIFDFPALRVSKQVFHVPGQAVDGGFTSGAVRILSPEPGGRSVLEMQVALQVGEWDNPESSWLMSKGNGEVFRVRLAPTPQVLSARSAQPDWRGRITTDARPIATDMFARYTAVALEGSTTLVVDMMAHGDRIRRGHVIGHGGTCYGIDKVQYDYSTYRATLTVKPPIRKPVAVGDVALFRPYFTGVMGNIQELRTTYDAENVGHIQLGKIVFTEAIV